MSTDPFRITLHMAASLDGMIAKKDNSVEWFETSSHYEKGVADLDLEGYFKEVDCFVMGARTYEHALELSKTYGWPFGDVATLAVNP